MGWSCTRAASLTLERIEEACKATRPADNTSSNTFFVDGREFFFEVTPKDQPGGGIIGEVYRVRSDNKCQLHHTFFIQGDGKLIEGPTFFRISLACYQHSNMRTNNATTRIPTT